MSIIRWIPNVPKEVEEKIEKENESLREKIWEKSYKVTSGMSEFAKIKRNRVDEKKREPIIQEVDDDCEANENVYENEEKNVDT